MTQNCLVIDTYIDILVSTISDGDSRVNLHSVCTLHYTSCLAQLAVGGEWTVPHKGCLIDRTSK